MAPHPLRRQICHRRLGRPSAGVASRLLDGLGPLQAGVQNWLASWPDTWRERIEIVAMDRSPGSRAPPPKNSRREAVMDPFHVVHLASSTLDDGVSQLKLLASASTRPAGCLHTDPCLLTRQRHQILDLFSSDERRTQLGLPAIDATLINAWEDFNAPRKSLASTPQACLLPLTELTTLGRTQTPSRGILAYFSHPTPQAACCTHLEHLRGTAPGLTKPLTTSTHLETGSC